MPGRAAIVAGAQTSALPHHRGGSVSVGETTIAIRPRTADARHTTTVFVPLPESCLAMEDPAPTYEAQRAMHVAAAAAASAQQGFDNIYLLEMLEDDALDAFAGELKALAGEWVRSGLAWWRTGRGVVSGGDVDITDSAGLDDSATPSVRRKKVPTTGRRWTWSSQPTEVKRKVEEQRHRAQTFRACTASTAPELNSPQASTAEQIFRPSGLPQMDPLPPYVPAGPIPLAARASKDVPPGFEQKRRISYGSGHRFCDTPSLRRRRVSSSTDEDSDCLGACASLRW